MTEQFCGNGHTVNPGEAVCVRCGTAAVSPIVPPGEASDEQIAAATGASQAADNDSTVDNEGQQVKTDEATGATDTAADSAATDTESKPAETAEAEAEAQPEAEQVKE